jgi:hypothetical protein
MCTTQSDVIFPEDTPHRYPPRHLDLGPVFFIVYVWFRRGEFSSYLWSRRGGCRWQHDIL